MNEKIEKDRIKRKVAQYQKKVGLELIEAARDQFISNVKRGHKVSLKALKDLHPLFKMDYFDIIC
jgi:hypothetical protein